MQNLRHPPAHLPFPDIGYIAAEGKHFQWVPVVCGPYNRAANVPLIE